MHKIPSSVSGLYFLCSKGKKKKKKTLLCWLTGFKSRVLFKSLVAQLAPPGVSNENIHPSSNPPLPQLKTKKKKKSLK
jgi:hypothetical protein